MSVRGYNEVLHAFDDNVSVGCLFVKEFRPAALAGKMKNHQTVKQLKIRHLDTRYHCSTDSGP